MSREVREAILQVLSTAIMKETNAFNFYSRKSEDASFPAGVRGLLMRLAEEERKHRRLLMGEYQAVEKGLAEGEKREGEEFLSYPVPADPDIQPLDVSLPYEAASVSLPTRLIGGDSIFASAIRRGKGAAGVGDGTFLFLYDVMGHSVETTAINALAGTVFGDYLDASTAARLERERLSPREVVRLLNRAIHEHFGDRGVFLTMLCAVFDPAAGSMTYTNAGHEPPFVVRRDGTISSIIDAQLVAGIDPDFPYREQSVHFGPGDLVCIFSDGIVEATDPANLPFGRKNLARALEGSAAAAPAAVIRRIFAAVSAHCAGTPLSDEVSIVVVKSKGAE